MCENKNDDDLTGVCGRQVLHFEQMLTTGGGWQDQVGGLSPGIKVGHSKAEIPVKIDVTFLKVSDEVIKSFGDQLVLVYTGKTRLARNLLQVVLSHVTNAPILVYKPRIFPQIFMPPAVGRG